jgi:hypothetical protein
MKISLSNTQIIHSTIGFKLAEPDLIGKSLSGLGNIVLKSKKILKNLADLLIGNSKTCEDHEFLQEFPEIGSRTMLLNVSCVNHPKH